MKNAMGIVKGVSAGIATGMLVGFVGSKVIKKDPKHMKKKASKAIHTMGEIVDGVSYMFK